MGKNHREDNIAFYEKLDDYNNCNEKNTQTLIKQDGKIKGLRHDMDEVKPKADKVPQLVTDMAEIKPFVNTEKNKKYGKAYALKILKGMVWILMSAGSLYGVWMKYKVG